jgi:hypothetical protein
MDKVEGYRCQQHVDLGIVIPEYDLVQEIKQKLLAFLLILPNFKIDSVMQ